MKCKLIIAAALLSLALPAGAQFVTVQQAYEVPLNELRLPVSESGTIGFKECDKCTYMTESVSPMTRYVVNGHDVTLEKFRQAISRVADRNMETVTVLHHLENDEVTQVSIYLR
jgi:hypothetical protein